MNEQRKRRKKKPVFQREGAVNQGVFEVPAVRTSWDTICPAGSALLAERFSVTWSQPIARFYEVGSNRIYYVGGRIGGRWGAGRIISPDALSLQFLKIFSVEA